MIRLRNNRALPAALLFGVMVLALSIGPDGPLTHTSLTTQGAAALTGFGFWETLGCIGCIAGFVVGAGTTIAGFAVFLAVHSEIAILCVSTCAIAVS